MDRNSFNDLLYRYQNGVCSKEEKLWVEKWYQDLNYSEINDLSSLELEEMEKIVWNKLSSNNIKPVKTFKLWHKITVAASIAVAFLMFGVHYTNKNYAEKSFINANDGIEMLTRTNNTNRSIIISLSDNSKITLDPKSNIIYPKTFEKSKRTVFLKGNAFFSVTKNPKQPFFVYNNKLVIKVLGTSFYVKSPEKNQSAQVSVRTGKVLVNENKDGEFSILSSKKLASPILLAPNQKAIFATHTLKKTLVEKPITIASAYNVPDIFNYDFKEQSLADVFEILSEAYGIEIISTKPEILKYTFTGNITSAGLYEKLDLICGSISAKYNIKGTQIVVSEQKLTK